MARLEFQNLTFDEKGDKIGVSLLLSFYFEIPRKELDKIGLKKVEPHALEFEGDEEHKFGFIMSKYMPNLIHKINQRPTTYVHMNSGIPLMGSLYFGITDKGTNILELKPNTGCNVACIFCSVGEGKEGRRSHDFVVECDYMLEETRKLVEFKTADYEGEIDIYINPHGEPLLYADTVRLVEGLRAIKKVGKIIIITNGTLLTESMVKKLEKAGLTQFNISFSALDLKRAHELMGTTAYNADKVKEMIKYISTSSKVKVAITPVYLHKINDDEIEKIIEFSKEIGCKNIGIQNFLINRRGKKPAKELSWDKFYEKLAEWENKYGVTLTADLTMDQTREYKKPFKRGESINAHIVCDGRADNEKIAVAESRCILVPNCSKDRKVKLKITKANHNLFVGEVI